MVDNLAEKVDEHPLNRGCYKSIVCVLLGERKLSVIRSSGVCAIQELLNLSIEVKGSTVGTSLVPRPLPTEGGGACG